MHTFGGNLAEGPGAGPRAGGGAVRRHPTEIVFTTCGTESDNIAIRGLVDAYPEKTHVVTTRVEHPAVLNQAAVLAEEGLPRHGDRGGPQGQARPGRTGARPSTTRPGDRPCMCANNETGVVFPVEEIAEIAKERGVFVAHRRGAGRGQDPDRHVAAARRPALLLRPQAPRPQGRRRLCTSAGALKFRPFLIGGHQERGRRGGTENVASIVGLGKAVRAGRLAPGRGEPPGCAPCATASSGGSSSASPTREVNGDREHRAAQHHQHLLRVRRGRGDPAGAGQARASAPPPARPAPPAASSPRTCCAPWACRSPAPTARCASA